MKILFATDGSEYSEAAARFLDCLNLDEEDEVTVFHAVSWVPFSYGEESYHERFRQIKLEVAPRIIDSALDILRPLRAKISTSIINGAPEKYIIEAAKDLGKDLIVMGARGVKGIKSLLIGSVTKAVARHSPVPVCVVKSWGCKGNEAPRILLASDGSDYSVAAATFLAGMPFREDAEINVLHVIWSDFSDIPERFVMEVNDRIKDTVAELRTVEIAAAERVVEQARALVAKRYRNIKTLTRVGDPATEILGTAESWGAHLIVVGCHGSKGVKGLLGSVSRNVLAHSRCSVLIGRPCAE